MTTLRLDALMRFPVVEQIPDFTGLPIPTSTKILSVPPASTYAHLTPPARIFAHYRCVVMEYDRSLFRPSGHSHPEFTGKPPVKPD
jgi:hypothetical protein